MSYTPPTKTISLNQYEVVNTLIENISGLTNGPNNSLYYTVYQDPNVYNLNTNSSYIDISKSNYTHTKYNFPSIVFDNLNNLYITDKQNSVVYKVDSTKNVTTLPIGGLHNPSGLCISDNYSTLYIVNNGQDSNASYNILSYNLTNNKTTTVFSTIYTVYNLSNTSCILFNNGYLYFTCIYVYTGSNEPVLNTIATNGYSFSSIIELGTLYNFQNPLKIAFDADNNLYVANTVLNNPYSLIGKFVPTYTSGVISAFTFYEAYTTQISSDNNVNPFITNPYTLLYYNNRLYCGNTGTLNNHNNLIAIYNELPYMINDKITNPGAYAVNNGYGAFPIYCSIANYTNNYYSMNDNINSHYVLPGYKLITFQDAYYPTPVQTIDNTQNIYVLSGNQHGDQISSCRIYYKNGEIIQTGVSCDSLPYP